MSLSVPETERGEHEGEVSSYENGLIVPMKKNRLDGKAAPTHQTLPRQGVLFTVDSLELLAAARMACS